MFENVSPIIEVAALLFTIFGAIWSLAWWLSGQFSKTHKLIYDQIKKLEDHFTNKLDYHERHDDQRFNTIHNDLWEMRVQNAAVRGIITKAKGPVTPVVRDLQDHFKEEI